MGAGPESFPFCPAWFVEVDVSVNEAGEEYVRGVVCIRCSMRERGPREDRACMDRGNLAGKCRDGESGRGQLTIDYRSG